MAETADVERAPPTAPNEDANEEPENEPAERVILHLSMFVLTVGDEERERKR